MNRYMPITGIECSIPSLLFDTQAPIDVLQQTADFRIRTATQALEALTQDQITGNARGLHEVACLSALVLRDGCDLMDVIGRRLRMELAT